MPAESYRIAQEAVTNAVRHGGADTVFLRLVGRKDTIELEVEDNGIGISDNDGTSEGLGLKIMSYRCESIGADLSIQGVGEKGTMVACTLPVGKVGAVNDTAGEKENGDK